MKLERVQAIRDEIVGNLDNFRVRFISEVKNAAVLWIKPVRQKIHPKGIVLV